MITTTRLNLYQIYLSRTIAALSGICLVSVFLYGIFLMLAVEHTATRTAMQDRINELTVELSTLEAQYLTHTRALSPERAAELGFVKPTTTSAVFAGADVRSLSFRD